MPPDDFKTTLPNPLNGGIVTWKGGRRPLLFGVGGFVALGGNHADFLLGVLPPVVHIKEETDRSALRWALERTMRELRAPEPGSFLVVQYLTRWRMLLAGDRLANSSDPIAVVARGLGSESESAFGTAFKRVMGCSPRRYSRTRDQAAPTY